LRESELSKDRGAEELVLAGIVEGTPKEHLGGGRIVVVQIGAAHEHPRPTRPRRQGVDEPVCEHERSARLAGGGELLDLRHRAAVQAFRVLPWRQPEAVPGQLGRELRGAAPARAIGGFLEQPCHACVRPIGRKRQMPGPDVRIGCVLGEPGMERPPAERAHALVHGRGGQRVREAHVQVLLHRQEPVPLCFEEERVQVAGHIPA